MTELEFMDEDGPKLLQQRLVEKTREHKATGEAAIDSKFRKLPAPRSTKNDKLVHNLSSMELTEEQMQVLRHEASFNVADNKSANMIVAVESILSQTGATDETKNFIRHQVSSLLMAHRPRDVISKVERDVLKKLRADNSHDIVPADKGRSTVVLDRPDYNQKVKSLLEDRKSYVPCESNPVKTLTREINATLLAMENSGALSPVDRCMTRAQETALARFYGHPKVHKEGAPLPAYRITKGVGSAYTPKNKNKPITGDHLSNSSMGQSSAAGVSQSVDHIAGSITEFLYDPQAHIIFDSCYKRYEDLFSVDQAAQEDAWKVRLLVRKLGPTEHERYANFILPKNPGEVTFKDTVQMLSQIFGEQSSLFNTRFQCLQLCKRDSDDFITYAGIVNLSQAVARSPLHVVDGSKKGIPVYSASRLQRWTTILLGYDFDIRYCRTTEVGQANTLSRPISNQQEPEEDTVITAISIEDDVRRQPSDAIRGIPVTAADIRRDTEQDPVLRQVITYVQTCWPTTALAGDLRQLFLRRASLRMKSIARSFAYWPRIDDEMDDLFRHCSRCLQAAKMPPRQPPTPWQPPERPWSRVHIDSAGPLNGVSYLILVDAYSKWPEIAQLNPSTAYVAIAFLRRIFSQNGLPEALILDNDSQFTSSAFEDFCRQHNIKHLRSPPYHPQSNGQAERFVDKTTTNPASPGDVSPAEALISRKLLTTFHALVPTGVQPAQTSPVSRSKLSVGKPVFVCDYRTGFPDWIEATIVAHRGSMLFDVDFGDDIWVRHRNQIRRRHCSNTTVLESVPSRSLDILLDTFAIPADRSDPEPTVAPPSDVPPSVSITASASPDNKSR
ncbi:hypothetical protein SprV_0200540600 [Sparganum proliferum]